MNTSRARRRRSRNRSSSNVARQAPGHFLAMLDSHGGEQENQHAFDLFGREVLPLLRAQAWRANNSAQEPAPLAHDGDAAVSRHRPRLDADPKAFDAPPLNLLLNGGGLEAARAANPYTWIHPGFPSTFILGGMADFLQPLEAGLELLHKLVEVGAEVEFHYLHSQHHEFCNTPGMLHGVMDEVIFFYRRTLLDREVLARESRELNIFARVSNREDFIRMMSGRQ